ncbi:hypothetical protein [Nocardia arizonensis]|uniref:hypothetical protein n=1 Tax=Nocardia arizonensis TaxID=1141647 RepID=UPI0012E2C004|nr:hypothetical protein [Nocardia arizonensis]
MTQWLPLICSLIIAGVALVGVLVNNRTNRDAILAADERNRVTLETAQRSTEQTNSAAERRERDKWRRDSILAAVSSVLAVSEEVREQLGGCAHWNAQDAEEIDAAGDEIHRIIEGCHGTVSRLRVLSNRKIPNRCEDLLRTLTAAQAITLQRLKTELDDDPSSKEVLDVLTLWHKAMAKAVEQETSVIYATRAELGIEVLKDKDAPEPPFDTAFEPVAEPVPAQV